MAAVSTALLVTAAVTAGASALGGIQANREAKKQAVLAEQQAAKQAAETNRITARQAELEGRNINDTIDAQKLAYLKSGVTLEGSPLLKLEETRRLGDENLAEINLAGKAQSEAQITEGRVAANQLKASGRQQLISGITGAAKQASSFA